MWEPRGVFMRGVYLVFITALFFSYNVKATISDDGYNSKLVTEILLKNPEHDQNLKKDPTQQRVDIHIVAGTFESKSVEVQVLSEQGDVIARVPFQAEQDEHGRWRLRAFRGYYVNQKLNEIIRFNFKRPHGAGTGVYGVELGYVFYENFNDWPVNIVGQVGIARHLEKREQKDFYAYSAMLKVEWTAFPWNKFVRTKFELAEGINKGEKVPFYEKRNVERKNEGRSSKLLNYLGVGLGFNLGDLFQVKSLKDCYVGGYVYHRSGVFGYVDFYNNVSGGSNFQSYYVECSL